MKIVRVIGEVRVRSVVEIERRRIAIKLIWMPGVRPVRVPAKRPRRIAMVSSKSISFIIFEEL